MDIGEILLGILSFVKLWVPFAIICFVLYKIFSPLRKKLADDHNLSWIRSSLLLNFVIFFVLLLVVFLYFFAIGAFASPNRGPELDYTVAENALILLFGVGRIIVASVILAIVLLFFEMLNSFITEANLLGPKSSSRKPKEPELLSQLVAVFITSAIFLVLLLFLFDWAILGLFVFVYYGQVTPTPLLFAFLP